MKFLLVLPFLLITNPISAQEEEKIPLPAQENIIRALEALQTKFSGPGATLEDADTHLELILSQAKTLVENSRQAETKKTEALFAKIEEACLSAEKPSDLDALFATVTKESLAVQHGYGVGRSTQQSLHSASIIIGCWQDHLVAKKSGDSKASLRALDKVIQSLQQSPCIARSKVLAIKNSTKETAEKQSLAEDIAKQEARAAATLRDQAAKLREQQEVHRMRNPMLPDPEWPTSLGSIAEASLLLERLRKLQLEHEKEHASNYSAKSSYGDLEKRLIILQLAAASGESSRPADVIKHLGLRPSDTLKRSFTTIHATDFPPPASLIADITDIEFSLILAAFESLFGSSVEIIPEKQESPRSYVTRLAEAFAMQEKFGQLTELLSLVQIAGIFNKGSDSQWVSVDIKGIEAYQKATSFLEAKDLRNAVPALREVIESTGRIAPAAKAAKILAELKTAHPEEMKRIR